MAFFDYSEWSSGATLKNLTWFHWQITLPYTWKRPKGHRTCQVVV